MEDIIDADYAHAKRICKDFRRKDLRVTFKIMICMSKMVHYY